jgi:glutathione S-transferase
MKLYGHPASTCTRKVLMTLAEKNATFEMNVLDFAKADHKSASHLARQPFGQMPVIDDNGFVLYESRAICRYLDETLPGTRLAPTDAKTRAVMEQWISVETSNFTPNAMIIIYAALFGPMLMGKPVDAEKVAEGRTKLAPVLDILATRLGETPFLAGAEFTLADVGYMPYVDYLYAAQCGDLIESRPALAKWWHGISDRKSWKVATGKA